MSDDLLKAFNAAADAAHIAALSAYEAIDRADECARALYKGTGFDRAGYSIETARRAAVELLDETADIGLVGHDTPRSRGVELPKESKPSVLKLYTWFKSNAVLTRPQEHAGSIRTHHPDAVALNVYGAQAIIECCRRADLYLAKQDIWECEYINTDENGCIRFKCVKNIETY